MPRGSEIPDPAELQTPNDVVIIKRLELLALKEIIASEGTRLAMHMNTISQLQALVSHLKRELRKFNTEILEAGR